MYSKVVWLANRGELPVDAETIEIFRDQLEPGASGWFETRNPASDEGASADIAPEGLDIDREVDYARYWSSLTEPGRPLHGLGDYRRFPNPAYPNQRVYNPAVAPPELGFHSANSKMLATSSKADPAVCRTLAERGLRSVLVGADGAPSM